MMDISAAFISKVSGSMGAQSATVNLHRESRWEKMSALEFGSAHEVNMGAETHEWAFMYVS